MRPLMPPAALTALVASDSITQTSYAAAAQTICDQYAAPATNTLTVRPLTSTAGGTPTVMNDYATWLIPIDNALTVLQGTVRTRNATESEAAKSTAAKNAAVKKNTSTPSHARTGSASKSTIALMPGQVAFVAPGIRYARQAERPTHLWVLLHRQHSIAMQILRIEDKQTVGVHGEIAIECDQKNSHAAQRTCSRMACEHCPTDDTVPSCGNLAVADLDAASKQTVKAFLRWPTNSHASTPDHRARLWRCEP